MSGKSAIEWTDATWNPVTGCSKISPGCANCYAETISLRFGHSKLPWTPENAAENVVLHAERLDQPLRWKKPRMVFVNSMSDLFHEEIPNEFIAEVFDRMRICERHTFQVLTKRPERALEVLSRFVYDPLICEILEHDDPLGYLPNVWIGVSIENARHTWRADVLREIPSAVRFISAEPLLGSLFEFDRRPEQGRMARELGNETPRKKRLDLTGIDWLIVGGESGHGARPMDPEWARELRDVCLAQCRDCNALGPWVPADWQPRFEDGHSHWAPCARRTAFFFKQVGGHTPKSGGRLLDGREWNEMPG